MKPTDHPKIYHPRLKSLVIIGILLIVAAIHIFRLGTYLQGEFFIWYYSYFSDIVVPFGIYFLLCLNEPSVSFLRKWYIKALIVFGGAVGAEILQGMGFYVLGVTFDIFDILMYGMGVSLAVLFDILIFEQIFPFWKRSGK